MSDPVATPGADAAPIPVIVNAGSGAGAGSCETRAREAFAKAGIDADWHVLHDCTHLDEEVDALLRARPPVLVAAGGDGTVAGVAARMLDQDTALAVVALGTLNHFAKDLGVPLEPNEAAQLAADGRRMQVDCAQVNEHVFLNNSSLGLYPRIVNARDAEQKRLHLGKWPALLHATWQALRDPHAYTLRLCVDGKNIERRTPFVFIGNNRYQLQGFGAGSRPRLDEGVLSLYVLRPQDLFGFLRLGLRALLGRVRSDQDFEMFTAAELEVATQRPSIEVAHDGEVTSMDSPLRYAIRPRALTVMAPLAKT